MVGDIRQAIRDFVVSEFKPKVPIAYDSPLVQQGIIDSLAIFMLIGFIDAEFGVQIDPDDVSLENFETINAMQELVSSRRGSAPPPGHGSGMGHA